jgi:hypothetical protein
MNCPGCGIKVGEFPEDAVYEETLCNQCYELEESEAPVMSVAVLNGQGCN